MVGIPCSLSVACSASRWLADDSMMVYWAQLDKKPSEIPGVLTTPLSAWVYWAAA